MHVGVLDAFEVHQRILDPPGNAFVHGAARRGERHLDGNVAVRVGHVVHEAKVHDVAADFGIYDLAQSVHEQGFGKQRCIHICWSAVGGGDTDCTDLH